MIDLQQDALDSLFWTLFIGNKLHDSLNLYTCEEAIAASVCVQLTDQDYIIASTRYAYIRYMPEVLS